MNFGVDTVEKFHVKYLKTEDVFFDTVEKFHVKYLKTEDVFFLYSTKMQKTQAFFHTRSQPQFYVQLLYRPHFGT